MFGGPRVYGWPGAGAGAGAGGGFHCARTLERGHGAGAGGGISPAGDWLLVTTPTPTNKLCKMLYRAEDGCKVPGPLAGVLVSCCGDDGMMGSAAAIWCPAPLHSGRGEGAVCFFSP